MDKQTRSRLTLIGWLSFLIGLGLLIFRMASDHYIVDLFDFINALLAIIIVLSAYFTFAMTYVDSDKSTKFYGGFFCPFFLVVVLVSMFAVIPLNHHIILEKDGPESAELVGGVFWYNPLAEAVFDYTYDVYGYVSHDSISVRYDYNGTFLEFHRAYRSHSDNFDSLATGIITGIIQNSTREYLGRPRIDQLYYLFYALPDKLPAEIVFHGYIDVVGYDSMHGPVVDLSVTD